MDPCPPQQPPARPGPSLRAGALPPGRALSRLAAVPLLALSLVACQNGPSAESRRLDQLEFKIQQLEQRLNKAAARPNGADPAGKPPPGRIKSITLRTGTDDDRLRIYWADGSTTDLPCTKEQATLACG